MCPALLPGKQCVFIERRKEAHSDELRYDIGLWQLSKLKDMFERSSCILCGTTVIKGHAISIKPRSKWALLERPLGSTAHTYEVGSCKQAG